MAHNAIIEQRAWVESRCVDDVIQHLSGVHEELGEVRRRNHRTLTVSPTHIEIAFRLLQPIFTFGWK